MTGKNTPMTPKKLYRLIATDNDRDQRIDTVVRDFASTRDRAAWILDDLRTGSTLTCGLEEHQIRELENVLREAAVEAAQADYPEGLTFTGMRPEDDVDVALEWLEAALGVRIELVETCAPDLSLVFSDEERRVIAASLTAVGLDLSEHAQSRLQSLSALAERFAPVPRRTDS